MTNAAITANVYAAARNPRARAAQWREAYRAAQAASR